MAALTTTPTPEQLQALLNGPAATAPTGVEPDLQKPPNLDKILILTLTLALTFATLAVSMRMYTKLFIIRSIAYEDYAIMVGWMLSIAESIPSCFTSKHGGGVHMWNIRLKTFFSLLYWINLFCILYCPLVFSVKLSILLQYLRIFVPNRNGNMFLFIGIQLCIWCCFIVYLVSLVIVVVQCIPRKKIWKPLTTTGHCLNIGAAYLSTAIFNVITDFAILILPMPSLWKLQMPKKKKVLTIAVFASGAFACVTSILRTYYAWKIAKSSDISYNVSIMGFWTFAEVAIGIIVSCAPILPKFFQHFGAKFYATISSKFKSGSNPGDRSLSFLGVGTSRKFTSPKRYDPQQISEIGLSGSWNESHHPLAEIKREYVTLSDYNARLPRRGATSDSTPKIGQALATKRDDIESGQGGF